MKGWLKGKRGPSKPAPNANAGFIDPAASAAILEYCGRISRLAESIESPATIAMMRALCYTPEGRVQLEATAEDIRKWAQGLGAAHKAFATSLQTIEAILRQDSPGLLA